MKTITEYIVIAEEASNRGSFIEKINQKLAEGFQPYGSSGFPVRDQTTGGRGPLRNGWCQAMVKYAAEN